MLSASGPAFGHLFHHAMRGQQNVRAIADEQAAGNLDTGRLQGVDFGKQSGGVDHQAVADYGLLAGPQDSAGDQLEDEFPIANEDGMPGIVAALIARDNVEAFGEDVDYLSFAFISPLRAQYDHVSHFDQTHLFYRIGWPRLAEKFYLQLGVN